MWCISQYCAVALLQADSEREKEIDMKYFFLQHLAESASFQLKLVFLQNYITKLLVADIKKHSLKSFILQYFIHLYKLYSIGKCMPSHQSQAPVMLYCVLIVTCKGQAVRSDCAETNDYGGVALCGL